MKFKRILAAITALAVASAAVLTLTIVSADSRDSVADFDKAVINDYDLVDYEDIIGDVPGEPGDESPEPEEGEVTDTGAEEGEPEENPEETVPGAEETDPEETDPEESQPEETDPEESTEPEETDPEESQPEEPDPEETLKPGDVVTYGDLTLEVLEDGTISVIGYISGQVAVIPEDVDGKPVTAIADSAFAGCADLRAVYIPASVTAIGSDAFACLSNEDSEYQPEFVILGYLFTYAAAYADENGIAFFALGGETLTDELRGVEVIFPDGINAAAALNVADGYNAGTNTSIYFIINLLDDSGSVVQPESPVMVKIAVPFGWKDETVGIYRADSGEKISSFIYDDYILFITDSFGELAMILETETKPEPEPEVTEPPVTVTEPPVTVTEPPVTVTEPPAETTPETTTAPAETTTTEPIITTAETTTPATTPEPAETTTTPAPEPEVTTVDTSVSTTTPPPAAETEPSAEEAPEETEQADETEKPEESAKAELDVPSIDVSVPTSITAIINPYGVPINIAGVEYGSTGIASPVYTIKNKTTTSAIKVIGTASVVVPVIEDTNTPVIQVVDSPEAVKAQNVKSLCAYVLAYASSVQMDNDSELPDLFGQGDPEFDADSTLVFADVTDPYESARTGEIAVLDKAEADGKFTYAQFKITGDITSDSVAVWDETDMIVLNLVLDIVPLDYEEDKEAETEEDVGTDGDEDPDGEDEEDTETDAPVITDVSEDVTINDPEDIEETAP